MLDYTKAIVKEWILWLFFGLDAISLLITYAPLTGGPLSQSTIPPIAFWLLPVFGVYWAGYRVYLSAPRTDDPSQGIRGRDRGVLDELTQVLPPNQSIRWLRDHDFGGPIPLRMLDAIHVFNERSRDPDFEFINPELEQSRRQLLFATTGLTREIGAETYPAGHDAGGGIVNRIPPEMRHQDPSRFRQIQERINNLADDVVKAYDNLIRLGRKKL